MAKSPETKVKFSIFNEEFNEGIKEMSKESKKLKKEFKLQSEQMKDTATATEKLEHNIKRLGAEQNIVKKKIKSTTDQLEKAKTTYGKNSDEANKLSNKLLDLKISEQKLENAIGQSKREIDKQAQAMQEAKQDADKYKKALENVGNKANDAGDKLTTGLSTPIAGLGAVAGASALSMDGAMQLLVGSLGATGDEATQLKEDLKEVWSSGFGDNPETVARAMAMVKQNIRGINDGEALQKATKNMLILADVTEADMSEATRGVNQLMHNFGLTAQEAMDLFVKGQQEGINYSNEMFDNISEYAPLFKDMGFSAEEYFSILANGTKNGAYNLDYINDLMKEFNIRVQDGSDKTADAFGDMSKETQTLFKKFENGKATSEELFNAIIPELENMDDQVKANQIGVELFGTKWEDMGSTTVYALDDVNKSMKDVDGSMKNLAKSQEEAFGIKFKKTIRGVTAALVPMGTELLEIAEEVTPEIRELSEWFAELSDESQAFLGKTLLVTAAIGPMMKVLGGTIGVVSKLTGGFGGKGLGGTLLRLASKAGPIGITIAALGAVGIAVGAVVTREEKLNDVSLEAANAMMKQHESTKLMIGQFEKLRQKSKLTTDEFGRFLDLQTLLGEATSPEAIKVIKDEMARLQKKSGLSNDELLKMVGYNKDLVEALPGATEKVTMQGNKVAGATTKLKKHNAELRKMAMLEMKGEFLEAAENYNKLLSDRVTHQKKVNMYKGLEGFINETLSVYNKGSVVDAKRFVNAEYDALKLKINSKQLSGEELVVAKLRLKELHNINVSLGEGEIGLNNQLLTMEKKGNEQDQQLVKSDQELSKMGRIYQKLQLNYLKNAGITGEKAKQAIQNGNILGTLDNQIGKLQRQKEELRKQTPIARRNSDAYRDAVGEIDDQIGKLQTAKGQVSDLAVDARRYTDELGRDVTKNVNTNLNPSVASINNSLAQTVHKRIRTSVSGPQMLGYAKGTSYHTGGPAVVGEKGAELVKQGNDVSLQGFGIMPDLKRGAQVFTHEQTKKLLAGMNKLPAYASGVGVSDAMAQNLNITGQNLATRQENISNRFFIKIGSSDLIVDGRKLASVIWEPVKENIERDQERNDRFE